MKNRCRLSFDLGLRGNFEDLYEWLDSIGAKECGDSVATFVTEKNREQITEELSTLLGEKARVYIIGKLDGKAGGRFIFGKRKRAPWSGYGGFIPEAEDET